MICLLLILRDSLDNLLSPVPNISEKRKKIIVEEICTKVKSLIILFNITAVENAKEFLGQIGGKVLVILSVS